MGKAHLKMTTDGSSRSPPAFKGCWGSTHLNFNQQKRWVFIPPLSGLKTNLKHSAFITAGAEMSPQQTPEQTVVAVAVAAACFPHVACYQSQNLNMNHGCTVASI